MTNLIDPVVYNWLLGFVVTPISEQAGALTYGQVIILGLAFYLVITYL